MDITLSLSREAINLYKNKGIGGTGDIDARFLADSFVNRGHNLKIVDPSEIIESKEEVYANKIVYCRKKEGLLCDEKKNQILSGDVFFVYNIGEQRSLDISKNFLNSLYPLERQYSHVLNDAESTSYEFKPKQKTLNLPWIPDFEVNSKSDLVSLVKSEGNIIAKPSVGAMGQGIVFLNTLEEVNAVCKKGVSNYFFEKFVPANEERRYIFLDNQFILGRRTGKAGLPGKERVSSIDFMEGNKKELEIAREAVSKTGMFFCTVDFRGDYLLEINGSGTGMMPPKVENKQTDIYDLSGPVVMAVERYVERMKNG